MFSFFSVHGLGPRFDRGSIPKCKRLRTIALAKADVVKIKMPAVEGVVDETVCKATVPFMRANRHTELWLEANHKVMDYLSKIVLHRLDESRDAPPDSEESQDARDDDNILVDNESDDQSDVDPEEPVIPVALPLAPNRQASLREFFRNAA